MPSNPFPAQESLIDAIQPARIRVLALISDPSLSVELASLEPELSLEITRTIDETIQRLCADAPPPDVILLHLADDEALRFSQILHQDPFLALIPVILIYDQAMPHDPAKLISLGAADLMVRPLFPRQLLHLIHQHAQTRQSWWDTFQIQAPEHPQRLLRQLEADKLTADPSARADSFERFRQHVFRRQGLMPDRVKYLPNFRTEQLYQLGEALYLDSWQMAEEIASFLGWECLDSLEDCRIRPNVLPAAFCRRNLVLPIVLPQQAEAVVLANPFQMEVRDILRQRLPHQPMLIAPPELIEEAIDPEFRHSARYREWRDRLRVRTTLQRPPVGVSSPVPRAPEAESEPPPLRSASDAQQMEQRLFRAYQAYRNQKMAQSDSSDSLAALLDVEKDPEVAPIIQLVHSLIEKAHVMGASDIHIEPWEHEVLIRYRIDGRLQVMHHLQPQAIIKPLITRLKIMSQLDIAEKRLPQDGQIAFGLFRPAHDIHLRLSVVPLRHGEKAVLRLLDARQGLLPLKQLGMEPAQLELYRAAMQLPHGMILHVGPTGSGKTTSLYAALSEINQSERNIQTIENPVEYDLPGINQLEVRHEIGLDFARALRAHLRQDPDVILVGEIRDTETAHVALEAALTGHLMFSTLHTNDAASTVIRLLEMGIPAYLIADSLELICSQRLLRRLCPACRRPIRLDAASTRQLGLPDAVTCFEAGRCEKCGHSGYRGRVGVYELLRFDDRLRKLISQPGLTSQQIKASAQSLGLMPHTLFQAGLAKLLAGETSLEEISLHLQPDAPEPVCPQEES